MADHLSHEEALEFWKRYFGNNIQVMMDDFCDAVQAEYSLSVIQHCLQNESNYQEDLLLQDFYEELIMKLSLD